MVCCDFVCVSWVDLCFVYAVVCLVFVRCLVSLGFLVFALGCWFSDLLFVWCSGLQFAFGFRVGCWFGFVFALCLFAIVGLFVYLFLDVFLFCVRLFWLLVVDLVSLFWVVGAFRWFCDCFVRLLWWCLVVLYFSFVF